MYLAGDAGDCSGSAQIRYAWPLRSLKRISHVNCGAAPHVLVSSTAAIPRTPFADTATSLTTWDDWCAQSGFPEIHGRLFTTCVRESVINGLRSRARAAISPDMRDQLKRCDHRLVRLRRQHRQRPNIRREIRLGTISAAIVQDSPKALSAASQPRRALAWQIFPGSLNMTVSPPTFQCFTIATGVLLPFGSRGFAPCSTTDEFNQRPRPRTPALAVLVFDQDDVWMVCWRKDQKIQMQILRHA